MTNPRLYPFEEDILLWLFKGELPPMEKAEWLLTVSDLIEQGFLERDGFHLTAKGRVYVNILQAKKEDGQTYDGTKPVQ